MAYVKKLIKKYCVSYYFSINSNNFNHKVCSKIDFKKMNNELTVASDLTFMLCLKVIIVSTTTVVREWFTLLLFCVVIKICEVAQFSPVFPITY